MKPYEVEVCITKRFTYALVSSKAHYDDVRAILNAEFGLPRTEDHTEMFVSDYVQRMQRLDLIEQVFGRELAQAWQVADSRFTHVIFKYEKQEPVSRFARLMRNKGEVPCQTSE